MDPSPRISKSEFKVALTCPTKLYYLKKEYPSRKDEDSHLEYLAEGGYMVELMAKLLHRKAVTIQPHFTPERSTFDVAQRLSAGDTTLFEATVAHGLFQARIDILQRKGKSLRLIEVKSVSVTPAKGNDSPLRGAKGEIIASWLPYLQDLAFQVMVLRGALPGYKVAPVLCLVNKTATITASTSGREFRLREGVEPRGSDAWEYLGDVRQLRDEHPLVEIDVSREVEEVMKDVQAAADRLAASLKKSNVTRIAPTLGTICRDCEYRLPADATGPNGFQECWGKLGNPVPHMLDLFRIDLAGGKNGGLVNELISAGKTGIMDIPRERLAGSAAARQNRQLDAHQTGREWIDPALTQKVRGHPGPLHFIDFEASRMALPFHVGMHPYELEAFQWSCHTLTDPGQEEAAHSEWLNDEAAFPNVAFARSLREQIGDEGTVYVWSSYEISALKEILRQMEERKIKDRPLQVWLERITKPNNPRVVDLCDLARQSYMHPDLLGSVSIKDVLPAVWQGNAKLRERAEFKSYDRKGEDGKPMNPYKTLPALRIGAQEESVREGTGAMRMYQDLLQNADAAFSAEQEGRRKLLLQYCQLDTAAMVIIWRHWSGLY
jgi:hypothetical protein